MTTDTPVNVAAAPEEAPAVPEAVVDERPKVVQDAERILNGYKVPYEGLYEECSSVFRTAKKLRETIHDVLGQSKVQVLIHETMTVQQVEMKLHALLDPLKQQWTRLLQDEEMLRRRVQDLYDPIRQAQDAVVRAQRGHGANKAWLGFPTKEQEDIHKIYEHKLKHNFDDAKISFQDLLGYPDGLLTRIPKLKEIAEREEKDVLDEFHCRLESLRTYRTSTAHEHQPAILTEAEQVLQTYKKEYEILYEECTSIFRTAKKLYENVHDVLNDGKIRIIHEEWTLDDFEHRIRDFVKREQEGWTKVLHAADVLRDRAKAMYLPIQEIEQRVKHARGLDPPNRAWLGKPTNEQATIRKVYSEKLRHNFAQAKFEYDTLIGYPDGLLSRVPHLKHGMEKEIEHVLAKLHDRAHNNHLIKKVLPTFAYVGTLQSSQVVTLKSK